MWHRYDSSNRNVSERSAVASGASLLRLAALGDEELRALVRSVLESDEPVSNS
jgi:hypothetical protein